MNAMVAMARPNARTGTSATALPGRRVYASVVAAYDGARLHPRHLVAQRRIVRAERLILLEQLPARAVERADRDHRVIGTLGEFGGLRAEKRAERAEERRDAPLEG